MKIKLLTILTVLIIVLSPSFTSALTLTVYPSMDGYVGRNSAADTDWSSLNNAAVGTTASSTASGGLNFTELDARNNPTFTSRDNFRSIYVFDTSALPDDATLNSATFTLYGGGVNNLCYTNCPHNQSIVITSSNPASTSTLVVADYATSTFGSVSFGSIPINSGFVEGANVFNLNASGLANISKTGYSKFGARGTADITNTPPVGTWEAGAWGYYSENGTSTAPTLTITYNEGGVAKPRTIKGMGVTR